MFYINNYISGLLFWGHETTFWLHAQGGSFSYSLCAGNLMCPLQSSSSPPPPFECLVKELMDPCCLFVTYFH